MGETAGAKYNDRRQHARTGTVFPVEIQVIGQDNEPLTDLMEAFTDDIGRGGMAITAKTLKGKGREHFDFVPHATRLKVFINIPVRAEPVEATAMVEWIEHLPGPVIDTSLLGISFEAVSNDDYERIISYVRWLWWRPRVISGIVLFLIVGLAAALSHIYGMRLKEAATADYIKKAKIEKSVVEKRAAETAGMTTDLERKLEEAQERWKEAAEQLMKAESERNAIAEKVVGVEEEFTDLLEKYAELSESGQKTESELQRFQEENPEEDIGEKGSGEDAGPAAESQNNPAGSSISEGRIKSEEGIYKQFREYILQEKVQNLGNYCYSHQGSIYYAAALFALGELRFKYRNAALAETTYKKVIVTYPKSIYALYASHRLEQIYVRENYELKSLADIYEKYGLPELIDYRVIKPYLP